MSRSHLYCVAFFLDWSFLLRARQCIYVYCYIGVSPMERETREYVLQLLFCFFFWLILFSSVLGWLSLSGAPDGILSVFSSILCVLQIVTFPAFLFMQIFLLFLPCKSVTLVVPIYYCVLCTTDRSLYDVVLLV